MRRLLLSLLLAVLAVRAPGQEALRLEWRFVAGGALLHRPALDSSGWVYVSAGDRTLYAVDPSGVQRWRFRLGARPSASPVVAYDGTVLAGTASGRLWALGPNGRPRWSYTAPSRPCLTPCLGADGSIYLPAGGLLIALSYRGEERWRYRLKADVAGAPAVGPDGTLYVAAADRRLLALAPTGERKWELSLPGKPSAPAVDSDGTLLVGASGVHRVSADGRILWSYPVPAPTAPPVLLADGRIAAGADNGKMYLLSPEGRKLEEISLGSPVRYAAVAAGAEALYVTTPDHGLLVLRLDGGLARDGTFRAKQAVHHAALAPDGSLYAGAEDWILYRLRPGGGHPGPAASAWPMAFHDVQHTGRAGALADMDSPPALALRELGLAGEEALKQRALDDIERHLEGERFLPVHLAVLEEVLGRLASEGVTILSRTSGAPAPDFPRVRERACRLLGELGSDGARAALLTSARLEPDLAASLAAMEALGRVGLDPEGELGYLLTREAPRADERWVLAGLEALYRVLSEGPSPAHPQDYRALAELARWERSSRVRERAREMLSAMRRRVP